VLLAILLFPVGVVIVFCLNWLAESTNYEVDFLPENDSSFSKIVESAFSLLSIQLLPLLVGYGFLFFSGSLI
jgi:hypothetical protein